MKRRRPISIFSAITAAVFLLFNTLSLAANSEKDLWPDTRYDPEIPTIKEVLGHEIGNNIANIAEITRYMEALTEAAPDRMRLFEYATSWEGRKLIYVAIGSPDIIESLDAHGDAMAQLSDSRKTNRAQADALIENLAAPVWLGYGVHGNEISSCEAAMFTAYHLLAAKNDPVVDEILKNTLVFIDPSQNPDGRDRFVNHFRQEQGRFTDEHRLAAVHNEPWPGGRTNHYLFDLNRDWFSMTQPETRGKVSALRKHRPVVVVDLHEMSGDSTYYFAPPAEPHNPHLVESQHKHLEIIGQTNAHWFDQFGFDYFTRETYDWFYPGYGDSWPAFYGAAATTYEQASPRGLHWRRKDGELLTYFDAVRHHFVASISTLSAAAKNREMFLNDYYKFQVTAVEQGGKGPVRAYGLPLVGDVSLVHKLANLLTAQGVEVSQTTQTFHAQNESFPTGSYLISLEQPMGRFVRTMFDENTPMLEEFLDEQERRRAKRLRHEMYDVTAWSFPHLFNVKAVPLKKQPRVQTTPVPENASNDGSVAKVNTPVVYLVPWGTLASAKFLSTALQEGLDVLSVDKSFEQNDRTFPGGTLVLKTDQSTESLSSIVEKLAKDTGAEVVASETTWVDSGVNFGSSHVVKVRQPRIALAWDTPTSSYSAGAARFVLEQEIGLPITTVRARQLASADLQAFDVLILPDGGYTASSMSDSICTRIASWTRDGGTLIALGRATQFLIDKRMALLSTEIETLAAPNDEKESSDEKKKKSDPKIIDSAEAYRKATQPKEVKPDVVPGAMLNAKVDQDHWLGAGLSENLSVLYTGNQIASPLKLDKGVNVAYFDEPDSLLKSGYLWKENRKQLAFKPFIMVQRTGRGLTIAFTSDPLSRGYQNGLFVPFASAVLRGPGHATRP